MTWSLDGGGWVNGERDSGEDTVLDTVYTQSASACTIAVTNDGNSQRIFRSNSKLKASVTASYAAASQCMAPRQVIANASDDQ